MAKPIVKERSSALRKGFAVWREGVGLVETLTFCIRERSSAPEMGAVSAGERLTFPAAGEMTRLPRSRLFIRDARQGDSESRAPERQGREAAARLLRVAKHRPCGIARR